jgi:ATP-binding cassette subfamily C protein CydD
MNIDQRLLHQIRSSRGTFLLTIGVGFIAGTLTVWQARSLSRVIGQVFIEGHSLGDVSGLLVLLLLIIILRAVFSWVGEFTSNTLAVKVKTDLRERLFSHLLDLGPSYAREERTGELVNVITEGIESLDAYFNQYLPRTVECADFYFPNGRDIGSDFIADCSAHPYFYDIDRKLGSGSNQKAMAKPQPHERLLS